MIDFFPFFLWSPLPIFLFPQKGADNLIFSSFHLLLTIFFLASSSITIDVKWSKMDSRSRFQTTKGWRENCTVSYCSVLLSLEWMPDTDTLSTELYSISWSNTHFFVSFVVTKWPSWLPFRVSFFSTVCTKIVIREGKISVSWAAKKGKETRRYKC